MDQNLSESAEMYLISIARLIERGVSEPVALARLAQELAILPASVNEMVHKLEQDGSLAYEPYQGVSLTDAGRSIAARVLRSRRLWETFLVDRLGVAPAEADSLACRFEHITPLEVVDRLQGYLHRGEQAERRTQPAPAQALSDLQAGQAGQVAQLTAQGADRAYLQAQGLRAGARLRVLGTGADGSLLVEAGGKRIGLAAEIAQQVVVHPVGADDR